ncbi:MAG: hypothetical protein KDD44_14090, partial [Bdellovibrionales bacterium]|nr:hypothetical protein [Bdellovibrionales bacterium]
MPTILLRPALAIASRRVREGIRDWTAIKRDLGILAFVLLTVILIYFGCVMLLRSFGDDSMFREIFPSRVIQLTFYTFFVLLLISNTVSSVGNIYSAHNMDLLLQTPLSNVRLYLGKLLITCLETGTMYLVFMLPMALAYCSVLGLGMRFFLSFACISIPFLLIPAGLSVVLATLFVSLSALLWRRGLLLLVAAVGVALWLLAQMIDLLQHIRFESGGTNAIVQLIGLFDNPNPVWLPSFWAAEVLVPFVEHGAPAPASAIYLLVGSAIGSVAIGFLVFDFGMLPVRSRAQGEHRIDAKNLLQGSSSDIMREIVEALYGRLPIPSHMRGLIIKDLT